MIELTSDFFRETEFTIIIHIFIANKTSLVFIYKMVNLIINCNFLKILASRTRIMRRASFFLVENNKDHWLYYD